jgi:hypothetical protein
LQVAHIITLLSETLSQIANNKSLHKLMIRPCISLSMHIPKKFNYMTYTRIYMIQAQTRSAAAAGGSCGSGINTDACMSLEAYPLGLSGKTSLIIIATQETMMLR